METSFYTELDWKESGINSDKNKRNYSRSIDLCSKNDTSLDFLLHIYVYIFSEYENMHVLYYLCIYLSIHWLGAANTKIIIQRMVYGVLGRSKPKV